MQNKQFCECGNSTSITSRVLHDLASIDNLLLQVQEKVFKKKVEMAEYLVQGEEQWKQTLLFPKMVEQQNQKQPSQILKRVPETIDLEEEQQQQSVDNKQQVKVKIGKKQRGLKLVKAQEVEIYEKQNLNGLEIDLNQDIPEQEGLNFNIELTEQDGNNLQLEMNLKDIDKIYEIQDSNENSQLQSENKKNVCKICFQKLTTKRSLEKHLARRHNVVKQTYLAINGNQILNYINNQDSNID